MIENKLQAWTSIHGLLKSMKLTEPLPLLKDLRLEMDDVLNQVLALVRSERKPVKFPRKILQALGRFLIKVGSWLI